MNQDDFVAEHVLHLLDNVVEIHFVAVKLVDSKDDRFLNFFSSTENILCADFHTILGVDKENACVGNVKSSNRVAYKVVAARAVDYVEFLVQEFCIADSGEYCVAIFFFHREVVAYGVAVFDAASSFYNSTLVKHRFCECGFPRSLTTNEGNVFNFVGFVNFHCIREY